MNRKRRRTLAGSAHGDVARHVIIQLHRFLFFIYSLIETLKKNKKTAQLPRKYNYEVYP